MAMEKLRKNEGKCCEIGYIKRGKNVVFEKDGKYSLVFDKGWKHFERNS